MIITLGKKCTIQELEGKKDRLDLALKSKKSKITVDVSKLEKIDTAFLQALLAVLHTCDKNQLKWEIKGRTEAFNLILESYGITI